MTKFLVVDNVQISSTILFFSCSIPAAVFEYGFLNTTLRVYDQQHSVQAKGARVNTRPRPNKQCITLRNYLIIFFWIFFYIFDFTQIRAHNLTQFNFPLVFALFSNRKLYSKSTKIIEISKIKPVYQNYDNELFITILV